MLKSPPGPGAPPLDTARLYRDYGAAVARWAARLARSTADAEDMLQEVFLVVERRRATLPELHCPAAWLYGITLNLARRRWREGCRQAALRAHCLTDPADEAPTPLDELERGRRIRRLDQALATLRATDRRLIWLWDVQRLPTERISALTGLPPHTLRIRRFRARRKIARRMGEAEPRLHCG